MKILLQAIKSLLRKVENTAERVLNFFGGDGIIKQEHLPDGYPYAYTVAVLPETTLTDRSDSFWGLGYGLDLMDNATYTVDWNGTRYSCVAHFVSVWGLDAMHLGSLTSGDEPGYPFTILSVAGNDTMIQPHDDSTTVTIAITGPKITKINAAYIPRLDATNIQNGEGAWSICSVNAFADTGQNSIAFGDESYARGVSSFAFGALTHVDGNNSIAVGSAGAHGDSSCAFGYMAEAYGNYSFAAGCGKAMGAYSFAKGDYAYANGDYSHAEGKEVIASGVNQFVYGKYNIEDTENKYIYILGNGKAYNQRSNAHTLDWEGNAWYAGTMECTAVILKSSTEGSTKRFKVTVDDSGTLSATETTE